MLGVGVVLFIVAALVGGQNGAAGRTFLTVGSYVAWIPISMLAIKNALEDHPPQFTKVTPPAV
jgi:hypothetical protein